MKKVMAIVMAGVMSGALAISMTSYALGTKNANAENISMEAEETEFSEALGGWETDQSGFITIEVEKAFEKATLDLTDAEYTSIALLAKQVVAGTNYAILCKVTPVVPDAISNYGLVYIYEDLDGNAELVQVEDIGSAEDEIVEGGYAVISDDESETADRARKALEKSLEGMVGADYEVITVLSYQVVAGENYELLCRITPVYPDAEGTYSIVSVYEDLDGECEITSISDLEYSLE